MGKPTNEPTTDAQLFRSCAAVCRALADRFEATADGALPEAKLRELVCKAVPVLLNTVSATEADRRLAAEWQRRELAKAKVIEECRHADARRRRT